MAKKTIPSIHLPIQTQDGSMEMVWYLYLQWLATKGGEGSSLPDQTGHDGEFLTTDGTEVSWGKDKVTVTPNRDEGGFVSGTTYSDMTFQEFVETLLCPYQAPVIAITLSQTVFHKGTTNNVTVTMTVTKKTNTLTDATLQVGSATPTTISSLIPNGGTATQTASVSTDTTFTFVVEDGKQTVTKTASVKYNDYRYHGVVDVAPANVTETVIHGLSTDLTAVKGYTYSGITMTNRRVCYAYPASYGNISLIKDNNGYDVTSSYTKTTVTVDGVSYNVYTMTNTGTLSNGSMIFS